MKQVLYLLGCLTVLSFHAAAQAHHPEFKCHNTGHKSAARTTIADPAEDKYDIKYVKFDLSVSNTSTHIAGSVATTAKVVAPSFSSYVFELNPVLNIDSVLVGGVSMPFSSAGVIRTVALPAAFPVGAAFTAQVFYSGTPASGALYYDSGINCMADPNWGSMATFTHGEAFKANQWWPCKQSLRDKIDSVDMWLTIADTLKAGSNGLLHAITPIDATHNRYEWKERYPIDYYLISFSVANYIDHSYYMHFTGSTDSMLVQNYIYNVPGMLATYQSVMDTTAAMINYYSSLFGRYPFWKEKYGHCMAPEGGGMEHQTMTTLGYLDEPLIAHELGHQWFGDNVTHGSWADIIMSEGMASYCADLWYARLAGATAFSSSMRYTENYVASIPGGTAFVDDTTSHDRIFDGRLSYYKGECIPHTLRFIVNNDATFFQILQNYQSQYGGGNATITDFKNVAIAAVGTIVNGTNLDTFFNQWAYEEGFPQYVLRRYQAGSDIWIGLDQTTSVPASVPFFYVPVEIRLHAAGADTIVRVLNTQPSQVYHFNWNHSVTTIGIDPHAWLIYKQLNIIYDPTLAVSNITATAMSIVPNPTSTQWTVTDVPANSTLLLMDMGGRVIWHAAAVDKNTIVPASNLASGMYLLQVTGDAGSISYKLVKE